MSTASSIRTPKEVWDNHSSYQWVYFAEEIKQRISFFLSDKLWGKNLELGGGWYLSHPGSTVVDISPKALEYNPAKEKIEFDLSAIDAGEKLPFSDHSFDHATMVSVYQYLKGGKKLRDEIMRVLKPGGELYIINLNGGGSGLNEGVVQGSTYIAPIEKEFSHAGFETLVENIPFRSDITKVQSLCVAMPGIDLFGAHKGHIHNQAERIENNKKYSHYRPFRLRMSYHGDEEENLHDETRNIDLFTEHYSKWELRKMNDLFYKIATYPVTEYSIQYRQKLETFTQKCLATTNAIPIITTGISNDISVDMMTEGMGYLSLHLLGKESKLSSEEEEVAMTLAEKYGLPRHRTYGHFSGNTIDEIINNYQLREEETKDDTYFHYNRKVPFSESEQYKIISFLSEIPLNGPTKELQDRLYAMVKGWGERDELILAKQDKQNIENREYKLAQRKNDIKQWEARQTSTQVKNIVQNADSEEREEEENEDEKPHKPEKPMPVERPWYCTIDKRIVAQKAKGYFNLFAAHKQRRKGEELLYIKQKCQDGELPIVGRKTIDYLSIIPYFPAIFDNHDAEVHKRYDKSNPDD